MWDSSADPLTSRRLPRRLCSRSPWLPSCRQSPTRQPQDPRRAMLAKEPFVFLARSRGPGAHDHILAICRRAGFSPQIVQEGSYTDLLSLVASGAGVAIVPTSLRAIRRAGVLFRPLRERPMTQLDMVWRQNAPSPVLREFLKHMWRLGARGIRPKVG